VHEEFLGSVRPRLAVISVGGGNSYGHPHSATLNAYERLGAAGFVPLRLSDGRLRTETAAISLAAWWAAAGPRRA